MNMHQKLSTILEHLGRGLIERESITRLVLLAALAGEHVLLIGPPGTAKSELARRLRHIFRQPSYFERLLTRFSTPEELFGPVSLRALEEDRFERRTAGYLPQTRVAFIDEIFKANSAILNSLLTLINERKFDNGAERVDAPLECLIGASNELPEGPELGALYDRFLVRLHVGPIQQEDAFVRLLELGDSSFEIPLEVRLGAEELREFRRLSRQVTLHPEVIDLIRQLRGFLNEEGIYVSDRRWRKVGKLLRVAAWSNDRSEVSVLDGWLLQHFVWNEPQQRQLVQEWYEQFVGASRQEEDFANLTRVIQSIERLLERDQMQREPIEEDEDVEGERPYQKANEQGQLLYWAPKGTKERDKGVTYTENQIQEEYGYHKYYDGWLIQVENSEISLRSFLEDPDNKVLADADTRPRRFSPEHLEGRLARVQDVARRVASCMESVEENLAACEERIERDLWLPEVFTQVAVRGLERRREQVLTFQGRIEQVHEGFEALPREEGFDHE